MSTVITVQDIKYMVETLEKAREDTKKQIQYKGLIFKRYGLTWQVKTKLSPEWTVMNCEPVDYINRMNQLTKNK